MAMLTKPEYYPWLSRCAGGAEARLTPAQREALTIVAYRQPITRPTWTRCAASRAARLVSVMERGWCASPAATIRWGRPQLYGTTKKFLQAFGFKTIRDLRGRRRRPGAERKRQRGRR